ncbi:MAG: PKD domain-containing protein, partial [Acidimicrobiia bacterium]
MKKWLLGIMGAITVIVLIGGVFLLGRLTGTSTADAADTTTSTTHVAASTTTEAAPTTTTSAPVKGDAIAVAGEDQIVSVAVEVTLDGSGSSDPNGEELGYVWPQIYGPDVTDGAGTLDDEAPTFPAPDTVSTLVFELTVDDGSISDPDSVVVHVVEDADTAVFIDQDAEVAGVGRGTMEEPFTTIASGVAVAEDRGGADLYLMRLESASYALDGELTLPPNVSLYGGYDGDWLRDPMLPTTVTGPGQSLLVPVDGQYTVISGLSIVASETSGTSIAAQFFTSDAVGGTVRIEDSTLVGGQGERGSYGVVAEGTFDLTVVRSSITGGAAGKGEDGDEAEPQSGAAAIPGRNADERDPGAGYNPGGEGGSAFAGKGEDGSGNPPQLGGSGGDAGDDGDDGDQLGGVGGGI